MTKFIKMPGTDDLVNLDHIVSINRIEEDEYLVALTSGSFTLTRNEYLNLLDVVCHNSLMN